MGISYINGWELDAPLNVYTIDGQGAQGNLNGWVAYTCQYSTHPSPQIDGLLANVDTKSSSAATIDGVTPIGGGSRSLELTAPNNAWIEFMSPPNLLDGGNTNVHGTGGKGLRVLGLRFFYRAPSILEDDQEIMCRFYDGALARLFQNGEGSKVENGLPLFRLSLSLGNGGAGIKLWNKDGPGGGNEALLATSSAAPLQAGAWSQIAIIVRLGPAQNNPETGEEQGLLSIYNDGDEILNYNGQLLFDNSEATPAQAIESFSFLASNKQLGESMNVAIDNVVVYDFWNPGANDFIDNTSDVITQNQVIQGVYPVDLGQSSLNSFGNFTAVSAGFPEAASHLHVQGDSSSTSNSPPDPLIAYNQGSYLITDTLGNDSAYTVDTWDGGKVNADWPSNISDLKAIRVINVCAGSQSGLKANLSINAATSSEAGSSNNLSLEKTLFGTNFQIISNTWDYNPDGNGLGAPGPLGAYAIDSLMIGLKASEGG